MAGEKFFAELAGESADYFEIGGVQFYAAPLTLREYVEFTKLPDGVEEQAAFLSQKLKRRVRGTKQNPDDITPDWILENVTVPRLKVLQHVLLHGEMPTAGEKGKP